MGLPFITYPFQTSLEHLYRSKIQSLRTTVLALSELATDSPSLMAEVLSQALFKILKA
jgi:hypothetical protein